MWSADNICKQFGPRSGPIKRRAGSGSKLFATLIVFLEEFFEKVGRHKKSCKITQETEVTDDNYEEIILGQIKL